jgi:YbbR domain-containing protein
MFKGIKAFTKTLPLLLTAFLLAVAVWIMAVTSSDPSAEKPYPNVVPVEIIGQSSNLVITSDLPGNISLTLRAPASIWDSLISQKVPVRAIMDLSGLGEGIYTVPIQVQIGIKPVEIRSYSPRSATVDLETLETQQFDIRVINQGTLAVGYQSNPAELSQSTVLVSGARSYVNKVTAVHAVVNLTDVKTDISQTIALQAVDVNGSVVKEVSLSPEKITVSQKVFERGGYRNVVVKVVTNGQVADGYRLTSLSVYPPTVTVYSSNTTLIDDLPGYIETKPIDLSQKTENLDQQIDLNLPDGVQVIDDLFVLVKAEIAPIIGNQSLANVPVEASGLDSSYQVEIMPEKVNVIISAPLNTLDVMNPNDLILLIDLTGLTPGTYTLEPKYSLNNPNIQAESISPTTFKVVIK